MSVVRLEYPKARPSYWVSPAAEMFEGLARVQTGGEFGERKGAITAAIQLLRLALEGLPLIDARRSAVYFMVKEIMSNQFAITSDDRAAYMLVRWQNMLQIGEKEGFRRVLASEPEGIARMQSFFNALVHKGEQERSDRRNMPDDDD